jgi:hypothetical protein
MTAGIGDIFLTVTWTGGALMAGLPKFFLSVNIYMHYIN